DFHVTGVQTCALPIWRIYIHPPAGGGSCRSDHMAGPCGTWPHIIYDLILYVERQFFPFIQHFDKPFVSSIPGSIYDSVDFNMVRSEERRVGKEGKSGV